MSNGAFTGQTSQLQAFVDQINKSLKCATPACNGILKPVTSWPWGCCVKSMVDEQCELAKVMKLKPVAG